MGYTKEKVENVTIQRDAEDHHVLNVDVEYPRSNPITTVEVCITCVRSADNIRIIYDYERDGWSILQASVFEGPSFAPDENPPPEAYRYNPDWQEVAFISAWQRQEDPNITRESEERRIRKEAFNEACEIIADSTSSIASSLVGEIRNLIYTVRDDGNPYKKKEE